MCPSNKVPLPNQRSDRRKNRTRRLLRNALFELMLEKGYESVTIEDITQHADLGRTTFYLHYRDKEDLLLESIKTVAEELKAQILAEIAKETKNTADISVEQAPGQKVIKMILEHAAANASLYLPILRGEGTPHAPAYIRKIIYQGAIEFYTDKRLPIHPSGNPPISSEILATFFSSSLLGILTWWLENDMPYSPEEVAKIYHTLILSGTGQIL